MNLVSWSWNPDILAAEESVFDHDADADLRAFNRHAEQEGLRELEELIGHKQANDDDPSAFVTKVDPDATDPKLKLYLPLFAPHASSRILAPPELTLARVRKLAAPGRDGRGFWWFTGPWLAALAADNHPVPELGLFVLLLMFRNEHDGVTDWACDAHVVTSGFTIETEADYELLRTLGAWRLSSNMEALRDYAGELPWGDWELWRDQV